MRKAASIAGVLAAAILIILVRTFIYQVQEHGKGEAAFLARDYRNAAVYYETAIHMYTPASPYIRSSIDRMLEIAAMYEKSGDHRWALTVYEDLRSALYAVRSFYTPYTDIIALCDAKIPPLASQVR